MNILIADDHKLVLEGLALLLSTFPFVDEVRIAENYHTTKDLIAQQLPQIILLDIAFGTADGRTICKELKLQHPTVKLIALTSHGDINTIKTAIHAGFDGYLLKSEDRSIFMEALLAVAKGETYLSPVIKGNFFLQGHTNKNPSLTKRELEIVKLIVDGKTTKEIGDVLFLAEKTVEHHRANIMLKLDVKNIASLVKKAILQGIVV